MSYEASVLALYQDFGIDEAILAEPSSRYHAAAQRSAVTSVATSVTAPVVTSQQPLMNIDQAELEAKALMACVENIEGLKQAIQGFQGLAITKTATQMVFADGNPKAKIMLIGDAPGADDDASGLPFSGEAGALLDKMIGAIGLDRSQIYLTNMLNWRPPGGRTPTDQELAVALPFIQKHIALVAPELVIFAGGVSAKSLLGVPSSISRLRAKWHDYSQEGLDAPVKATALYHPSYLLQSPAQKRLAWEDLQMIQAELKVQGLLAA